MDRLEAEWGDEVQVLRVDVQDPSAQPLLTELGFRFTPTFIVLDGRGQEVWRTNGSLDPNRVNEQIRAITDG